MSNAPDPRIAFATDVFIREMKRQWIRQHPSADPMSCPVQIIDHYHPMQQIALRAAIAKAAEAVTGLNDQYATWLNFKLAGVQPV